MLAVANGGADDGRLQAGERTLEELVVAGAGLPPNRSQELIGREAQELRGLEPKVLRLDDLEAWADRAACSSTSDPRYVEARAAGHAHR